MAVDKVKAAKRKESIEDYAKRVAVRAEEQDVGFAWIAILPLLIPLVEKLLAMCFDKDPAKLAQKIAQTKNVKKGHRLRKQLMEAISDELSHLTSSQRGTLATTMIEVAGETSGPTLMTMNPAFADDE